MGGKRQDGSPVASSETSAGGRARGGVARRAAALALGLLMLESAGSPAGAVERRVEQAPGHQTVALPSPVPVVDWSMPKRFGRPQTFEYVNPASWSVTVDACASYSRRGSVTRVSWHLRDPAGRLVASSTTCRKRVAVKEQGPYDVDLTVEATDGTARARRRIVVKDHLIVVAGDSMASGEGNPDVPGYGDVRFCSSGSPSEFTVAVSCLVQLIDFVFDSPSTLVEGGTPATWHLDRDCHRSYRSGLSLAAREIEDRDPRSSVTFLNVACSGAETKHVWSEPYEGQYARGEAWDTGTKPVQAEHIAELLCGRSERWCTGEGERDIDALFLSIGINDLGFGGVIEDCSKPEWLGPIDPEGCAEEQDEPVALALSKLSQSFRSMDARFAALGLELNGIYKARYPTDVFSPSNDGCGVMAFVNSIEKAFLDKANDQLNFVVSTAGGQNFPWYPVWRDPQANPWKGHGYCAGDQRWMVTLTDSLRQHNGVGDDIHKGTMHPNARGHAQLRREFVNEFDQRTRPVTDTVEVTFEAVQATDVASAVDGRLFLTVARRGSDGADRWGEWAGMAIADVGVLADGRWHDLGAQRLTLRLGLNAAERLSVRGFGVFTLPPSEVPCPAEYEQAQPRRAAASGSEPGGSGQVCLRANLASFGAAATYGKDQAFGFGTRTATDPTGRFAVRYRISRPDCPRCIPPVDVFAR